jgi:hypothetical protein
MVHLHPLKIPQATVTVFSGFGSTKMFAIAFGSSEAT